MELLLNQHNNNKDMSRLQQIHDVKTETGIAKGRDRQEKETTEMKEGAQSQETSVVTMTNLQVIDIQKGKRLYNHGKSRKKILTQLIFTDLKAANDIPANRSTMSARVLVRKKNAEDMKMKQGAPGATEDQPSIGLSSHLIHHKSGSSRIKNLTFHLINFSFLLSNFVTFTKPE